MILSVLLSLLLATPQAFAQEEGALREETIDSDPAESLFQDEAKELPPPLSESTVAVPVESLSEVRRLEPFKDIAVIQRRYLPKTKRFELNGNGGLILNDSFFQSTSFGLRFAYNFSEAYGVELIALSNSTSTKEVTRDLKNEKGVTTESIVTPESFFGGAFKWSPIYGKISWRNQSIVPFDLHFLVGGGSITTNHKKSENGFYVGSGQTFAISKRYAFRWDFSWMFFSTTSTVTGYAEQANYNNLYLTVGLSWFFPEVSYR